jgi:hypothetical protein
MPFAPIAYIAAAVVAATYFPVLIADPGMLPDDLLLALALSSPTVFQYPAVAASVDQYIQCGGLPGDRKQRELSRLLDDARAQAWMATLAPADMARAQSATTMTSHGWLLPRPFEDDVESWMSPAQFQALVRLRLGMPQYPSSTAGTTCRLCFKAPLDVMGRHSLTCMGGGLRTAVHNLVRDLVHRLASTALLGPRLEELCFQGRMGADLLLCNVPGRPIAIDFAITHLNASGSFARAAAAPGGAATRYAVEVKQTKYSVVAEAAGLDFRPCVFDTHGACDPQGMKLLRYIARAWGNRFDIVPSRAVPLVIQRVSATLMRGIAQLLLANVGGT